MGRKLGIVGLVLCLGMGACTSAKPSPDKSPSASPVPSGPSIPTDAKIKIVTPAAGSVIHAKSLTVKVKVIGATIIPYATTAINAHQGHIHIKLDGQRVTYLAGATYQLTGLTPGRHLLQAEFVEGNHVPFTPRVIDVAPFTVS